MRWVAIPMRSKGALTPTPPDPRTVTVENIEADLAPESAGHGVIVVGAHYD
jgi:hypothetical protein